MLAETRRRQLRTVLAMLVDAGAIVAAFTVAYLLRFRWQVVPAADSPPAAPYFAILTPVVPLWLLIFAAFGLYRDEAAGVLDDAAKVAGGVSIGIVAVLAGSFFYRDFSFSRLWILFAWGAGVAIVTAARGALRALHGALRARGLDLRRVLIAGAGPVGQAVARALAASPRLGQVPVGFLDDAPPGGAGLPVLGAPGDVLRAVRAARADRVIVALPAAQREAAIEVVALCQEAGVPVAIVPDLYALVAAGAAVEVVGKIPLLAVGASRLEGWAGRAKDAVDVAGALAGLLLTLPLWLLIAALIRLDSPGPVLYRQRRIGRGGVPFSTLKFRTMTADAESRLRDDAGLRGRFEQAFKLPDDPRVTRVGRWLRRTCLDELPQLLNVLRGEMSLVGPRPIVEEELRHYGRWERRLLCARPGLTGLWQVLRRADLDYTQRVSLDLYYIEHWSVGLDLKILLRTVPAVVAGRGAY